LSSSSSTPRCRLWFVVALFLVGALGVWLWTPDLDRAVLEAKYGQPPSRFVEAAGVRIHVRDTGKLDGPAVVLIHGFGSSLHTWDGWAKGLEATHRVVRYDLTGGALTGPDPTGDYTDARALVVLQALLDRLGIDRTSLVGNSIGGRLAWRFASQFPARVDKLVLVSPDGFASPGFEYGRTPEVPAVMGVMKIALPRKLLEMNLAPAYGDTSRLQEPVITRYHDLMRVPGVRAALLQRLEQTILEDPTDALRAVTAPTLLVWGERDQLIPVANAQDYLRVMRDARLVTFPGIGHVPQEEAAEATLPPVRDFLTR